MEQTVKQFAMKGLRVLCFAMKQIDLKGRNVDEITLEEAESDLKLLAVTAVEDLLQQNVK